MRPRCTTRCGRARASSWITSGLFADGVAVKRVGEEGFALAQKYVDEMVLVNTDEICAAIQDVFEDTRVVPEPAGALSVAGLKKYVAREGWKDKRLVAINCGANLNFDRLRYIAERADLGAGREALLAVEIPEQPGSFLQVLRRAGGAQHHRIQLSRAGQGTRAGVRGSEPYPRRRGAG